MNSPSCNNRRAYTLLEILIAVTLMLMIMYAVSVIFGRVGSIINETQNTMTMANNLRNVAQRLETDLKNVTVPMTPPRHSANNEGFFCYSEGIGASFQANLLDNQNSPTNPVSGNASNHALDSERGVPDTTIGDNDDILSFTVKAPPGQPFRGRMPDAPGGMIESDFAEIVWFLRGTTLYRRVLLIVPQNVLKSGLTWLNTNGPATETVSVTEQQFNGTTNTFPLHQAWFGDGFFRYFDVSVHPESFDNQVNRTSDGVIMNRVVANTLGDLSNRKNRYGYRSSVCNSDITSLHGDNGAWYWLRLPTLQESAYLVPNNVGFNSHDWSFRAGDTFGRNGGRGNPLLNVITAPPMWNGYFQTASNSFGTTIDYWNYPNCWTEVVPDTGDIAFTSPNVTPALPTLDQDVMLTNVLSFDVKAWDENTNQFVDLGAKFNLGSHIDMVLNEWEPWRKSFSGDFKTIGWYDRFFNPNLRLYDGNNTTVADRFRQVSGWVNTLTADPYNARLRLAHLPAFYDTWTEQYEMEYANYFSNAPDVQEKLARIPTSGPLQTASLEHFPPPYDLPLKAIQVEIRIFDPKTKRIRNLTVPVEFTRF